MISQQANLCGLAAAFGTFEGEQEAAGGRGIQSRIWAGMGAIFLA
jgi:hypothetical protein